MERKGGSRRALVSITSGNKQIEDQALSFHTSHYLCRQEVAPAGSKQLWAQDPVLAQRCGTKGRTGHQELEGRNGDGNRGGGGREVRGWTRG